MSITVTEMTKEDMDNLMSEHEARAIELGFETVDKYEDFKANAAEGLIKFGGSFTHHLGHALARADSNNSFKLIMAYRSECEHHAALYITWDSNRFKEATTEG